MCECGCSMGNPAYRLPIDARACYVIELYPGCDNCSAAPGVIVRRVDRTSIFWDELQEALLFPLSKVDDCTEGAIKCGLDPDEFRKEAVKGMVGTDVEDGKIDDVLADILAEDIWKDSLRRMPEVIDYATPAKKTPPAGV